VSDLLKLQAILYIVASTGKLQMPRHELKSAVYWQLPPGSVAYFYSIVRVHDIFTRYPFIRPAGDSGVYESDCTAFAGGCYMRRHDCASVCEYLSEKRKLNREIVSR
jgi:hypothetical protein